MWITCLSRFLGFSDYLMFCYAGGTGPIPRKEHLMSRQNKKERNRLKRKRKQQELRKKRNASVFQTLAQKEGPVECFINSNWHESGEANVMVLRPVPGGSNIFAAFLVDL